MKKISLGIDMGTSKLCVGEFEMGSRKWKVLRINRQEALFTEIEIPLHGEPKEVVLASTKRCVLCELSTQIQYREIEEANCFNIKNFSNNYWCKRGKLEFTIDQMEYSPTYLFIDSLRNLLEKVEAILKKKHGDYKIWEIKVGFPMIFHRGEFYAGWLDANVSEVAKEILGHRFEKETQVGIVEEPMASLMSYCYGRRDIIPQGYILTVDIGAGTTDLAICEREEEKLTFIGTDSKTLGGDDYDKIMMRIIEDNVNRLNSSHSKTLLWENAKQLKEYYCRTGTAPTLSLVKGPPVTLDIGRIDEQFRKVDDGIIHFIRNFLNKNNIGIDAIKRIYLTGGGINVPSLRRKIQQLVEQSTNVIDLQISEANITKLDDKIACVAAGAAIPKNRYLNLIKYALPVSIMMEKVESTGDLRAKYEELGLLYEYGKSMPRDKETLTSVDPNCTLVLRTITTRGDRRELKRINPRHYYRKRKKKRLDLTQSYVVEYNGKFTIKVQSTHKPQKNTVYDGFILV